MPERAFFRRLVYRIENVDVLDDELVLTVRRFFQNLTSNVTIRKFDAKVLGFLQQMFDRVKPADWIIQLGPPAELVTCDITIPSANGVTAVKATLARWNPEEPLPVSFVMGEGKPEGFERFRIWGSRAEDPCHLGCLLLSVLDPFSKELLAKKQINSRGAQRLERLLTRDVLKPMMKWCSMVGGPVVAASYTNGQVHAKIEIPCRRRGPIEFELEIGLLLEEPV